MPLYVNQINPDLSSTSQAPLERRKQFRMQARIPSPKENSLEESAGRTGEMALSIAVKYFYPGNGTPMSK